MCILVCWLVEALPMNKKTLIWTFWSDWSVLKVYTTVVLFVEKRYQCVIKQDFVIGCIEFNITEIVRTVISFLRSSLCRNYIFIFSYFICCDGSEGVCMYVCASMCVWKRCSSNGWLACYKRDVKPCINKQQTNKPNGWIDFYEIFYIRSDRYLWGPFFLWLWNFRINDVMVAILYVFLRSTLTVAILL